MLIYRSLHNTEIFLHIIRIIYLLQYPLEVFYSFACAPDIEELSIRTDICNYAWSTHRTFAFWYLINTAFLSYEDPR